MQKHVSLYRQKARGPQQLLSLHTTSPGLFRARRVLGSNSLFLWSNSSTLSHSFHLSWKVSHVCSTENRPFAWKQTLSRKLDPTKICRLFLHCALFSPLCHFYFYFILSLSLYFLLWINLLFFTFIFLHCALFSPLCHWGNTIMASPRKVKSWQFDLRRRFIFLKANIKIKESSTIRRNRWL